MRTDASGRASATDILRRSILAATLTRWRGSRRWTATTSSLSSERCSIFVGIRGAFSLCWRKTMGKKRKIPKRTPEELARSEAIWRKLEERLAYHKAKLAEERAARGD